MKQKKQERPSLDTWLWCPVCGKRDYRYSIKGEDYLCKVCGARFHADHKKKKVWKSLERGTQVSYE